MIHRSLAACAALIVAATGCGASGSADKPNEPARLTSAEASAIYSLGSDVTGYCNATSDLAITDVMNFAKSQKAMGKVTAEYGRVLKSMDAYVAVLRRRPDALPPTGNPLLDDTARHTAEDLLSDELAGCTSDDEVSRDSLKQWRSRLRTVLSGLPPAAAA